MPMAPGHPSAGNPDPLLPSGEMAALPALSDAQLASAADVVLIQAFYRRILESLPAQLAVFSPQGVYEYVTPSAIADPVVREWIIGRTDVEFAAFRKLPPDVPARRMETIAQVAREGSTITFEESFTSRDGDQRWFRRYVTPVKDANGNVQHVLGYGIDITEQRRAEDQLRHAQKMEAVGRLAGGVAHDFNNLITVIGGFAETLDGTFDADDPRQEAVLSIREAANRASALTRQLLSFSRRAPLELITLDVHEAVLDTVHLLERVIGEKIRVSLSLHAAKHHIRADAGQFKQVLMNLVLNARDAMPAGGDLRIVTRKASPQTLRELNLDATRNGYIELEVADTGVGMTSDTVARVFEPFFTTKGPDKGTGLGLSTVYGIVSQIGGQVAVSSVLDRGSTFRVIVPVSAAPSGRVRDDQGAAVSPGEAATLLVAEDEDGVRLLVTRILRAQGHRVLEVSSGTEAMRVINAHEGVIDLLVTDVIMGDFGGRMLADAARLVRPQLRVLYMSGYPDQDNLLDVRNPTESFLEKPFTVEGLKTRVDMLLRTPVDAVRHA